MHSGWFVLRSAWSVVVIAYWVLAAVAVLRLRGAARDWNRVILVAMVLLVAARMTVRYFFGGLAYQYSVMIVGLAAGVASLIVAKMLITRKAGNEAVDVDSSKDRIQPLKLS